jgi:hypothetical protein
VFISGLQRFCNTSLHGCLIEEIFDEVKSAYSDSSVFQVYSVILNY